MKYFDNDYYSDEIEDDLGVPYDAVEEIYGYTDPFGEEDPTLELQRYEEEHHKIMRQSMFDEVIAAALHVIQANFGVYPRVDMLRKIEKAVREAIASGYKLSGYYPEDAHDPEFLEKYDVYDYGGSDDEEVPF